MDSMNWGGGVHIMRACACGRGSVRVGAAVQTDVRIRASGLAKAIIVYMFNLNQMDPGSD